MVKYLVLIFICSVAIFFRGLFSAICFQGYFLFFNCVDLALFLFLISLILIFFFQKLPHTYLVFYSLESIKFVYGNLILFFIKIF